MFACRCMLRQSPLAPSGACKRTAGVLHMWPCPPDSPGAGAVRVAAMFPSLLCTAGIPPSCVCYVLHAAGRAAGDGKGRGRALGEGPHGEAGGQAGSGWRVAGGDQWGEGGPSCSRCPAAAFPKAKPHLWLPPAMLGCTSMCGQAFPSPPSCACRPAGLGFAGPRPFSLPLLVIAERFCHTAGAGA